MLRAKVLLYSTLKEQADEPILVWSLERMEDLLTFSKPIPHEICKSTYSIAVEFIDMNTGNAVITFTGEYIDIDPLDEFHDYNRYFCFPSSDAVVHTENGYSNSEQSYFSFHVDTFMFNEDNCVVAFEPDSNWTVFNGKIGDRGRGIVPGPGCYKEVEPEVLFRLIKIECGLATLEEKLFVEPTYRSPLRSMFVFAILLKRHSRKVQTLVVLKKMANAATAGFEKLKALSITNQRLVRQLSLMQKLRKIPL